MEPDDELELIKKKQEKNWRVITLVISIVPFLIFIATYINTQGKKDAEFVGLKTSHAELNKKFEDYVKFNDNRYIELDRKNYLQGGKITGIVVELNIKRRFNVNLDEY